MHIVAAGQGGIGHRLETQAAAGNITLKTSGLESNFGARELIMVGFDYIKVSVSIKGGDRDYHLHGDSA
jgi:predicted ATP-dependent Lon-type protease